MVAIQSIIEFLIIIIVLIVSIYLLISNWQNLMERLSSWLRFLSDLLTLKQ